MFRKRRVGAGVLAAALTAALLGPVGSAQAAPAGPTAAGQQEAPGGSQTGARGSTTVTLITGDRLTLSADGRRAAVRHGEGRAGVTFLSWRARGHLYVVPSDALALLNAGRLDRRLFDVTMLRDLGYDDRRGDLPLIIKAGDGSGALAARAAQRASLRAAVGGDGVTVVRDLAAVNGLAARAGKGRIGALWQRLAGRPTGQPARTLSAGATKVWLDGRRKPTLDVSVPQIGAPTAWRDGHDGRGVTVAVLDTGIDRAHPDLAGKVAAGKNFAEGQEDDKDRVGHGTHVASTIAGSGAASGGKYRGVAPGATLLDGKVCVTDGCDESWILAGMQWAVDQKAAVVNLSLGGEDSPGVDPLEEAVNTLTAQSGTLFVIAAGNEGADATVGSPASADAALAVGAVDKKDELADFSSRGPRVDGALKPDITAPGAEIMAANSADGSAGEPGQPYVTLSGTSMATPHVAGAAAILKQRRPAWSAGQLKATLMASAKPHAKLGAYAQGAGRVDVARAIGQVVTADPPSISFGRQLWPHGDDKVLTRTVTYRNAGTSSVTLSLTTPTLGPDGKGSPAGTFRLSASTLTVPAGGTASVTITADTRVRASDGFHTGRIVATGPGEVAVQTPFAVEREVESYDVKLVHRDRTGKQTGNFVTSLSSTDGANRQIEATNPDGALTVRVPKGRYALVTFSRTPSTSDPERGVGSLLAQPRLVVDRNRSVNMDARLSKPIKITVPRADAASIMAVVEAEIATPGGGAAFSMTRDSFAELTSGQLGPRGTAAEFTSSVVGALAKLDRDGSAAASPYFYNLVYFDKGRMMTGFTKRVTAANVATVDTQFLGQGPPLGMKQSFGIKPGSRSSWDVGVSLALPTRRTYYYSTDNGVAWQSTFEERRRPENAEDFDTTVSRQEAALTTYQAGKTYRESWNAAPFAPTVANPTSAAQFLTRTGDTLLLGPSLFGDAASHVGLSGVDSARLTVLRDGRQVFDEPELSAEVDVPAGAARYTVRAEATRGAPHRLSTKVVAEWTFRSGHVPDDVVRRLPVSSVHFAPKLNEHNTAPAGRDFAIPVTVQRQPGSAAGNTKTLRVEVSYDDGRTWTDARVAVVDRVQVAQVTHPNRAGFVSLRGTATDTDGNTTQVTVVRAYEMTR